MIIDTIVLSALVSRNLKIKNRAVEFLSTLPHITTSAVVIYEIEYGLLKAGSKNVLKTFRQFIQGADVEVVPVSHEIAALAAEKRAEMAAKGFTLHTEDLFIGATAKILGVPLATQNRSDFESWDLVIVSPLS